MNIENRPAFATWQSYRLDIFWISSRCPVFLRYHVVDRFVYNALVTISLYSPQRQQNKQR